ncbi:hypothetical protein U8607_04170 [Methylobacterium durans]|uniref:hypothetical protein n=1 Tax=Methylobacterium durans TaxID=2202825 RepID=UPI002AFDEFD0|nr:hypothetical protein [Methylobacterium durans]MEA1831273.1 hypothetical protein [Methylobacterium durans]
MTEVIRDNLKLPSSSASVPPGYMRLEDALNVLGGQDYPSEWGLLPGWSHMPFRYSKKDKRYVRHEMRLMGTRARLQKPPVHLDLTKAEKQACTRLYRKVRDTLREALFNGELKADAAHYVSGVVTRIDTPVVWWKQARPIFFAGNIVIRDAQLRDELADVIIEKEAFGNWLKARSKMRAKVASEAMLRTIGKRVADHGRAHNYRIPKADTLHLVRRILKDANRTFSDRQFYAVVWKQPGKGPGAPKGEPRARYPLFLKDLEQEIRAIVVEATAQ